MLTKTRRTAVDKRHIAYIQNVQDMLKCSSFSTASCPHEALQLLRCTQDDLNYNKAWIFMMSRKLKYQGAEEVAFQACSALLSLLSNIQSLHRLIDAIFKELKNDEIRDNVMQILASCSLHIVAKLVSSENITNLRDYIRMMKLEGMLEWPSLSQIEKLVFISLHHHPFRNVTPINLFFEIKKAFNIRLKVHDNCLSKEEDEVESGFCTVILKTVYCSSFIETIPLAVGTLKFLLRQYLPSPEMMLVTEKEIDFLLEPKIIDQSNKVVKDIYGILLLESANVKSIKAIMEGLLPHANSIAAALSAVKLNVLSQLDKEND